MYLKMMFNFINVKDFKSFFRVYILLCTFFVVSLSNAQQETETLSIINWDKEQQAIKRYQYANSYIEQVLSNKLYPLEQQVEWINQISWCILKGIRMSNIRYMRHFNDLFALTNNPKIKDVEKKHVEQDVERYKKLTDDLSHFEGKLISINRCLSIKIKGANSKIMDAYLLNKGNLLLLTGGYDELGGITDIWYKEKPHLYAVHRAMYYLFSGDKTSSLKWYMDAIEYDSSMKNRAETAEEDYDVFRDMQLMISMLKKVNDILDSNANISKTQEENLNQLYLELRRLHERISYAPTQDIGIELCNEWFYEYSSLLKTMLKHSEEINNKNIHIINKDKILFLYFIAF